MHVRVIRHWEDGKLVPRWQRNRLQAVTGELRLEECKDQELRRTLRMARLLTPTASGGLIDAIHPLSDAAILSISGNRMSIAGIERYDGIFASVAQTWLVEVIALEPAA